MTSEKTTEVGSTILSANALDALEWAKKFLNDYERKHKIDITVKSTVH